MQVITITVTTLYSVLFRWSMIAFPTYYTWKDWQTPPSLIPQCLGGSSQSIHSTIKNYRASRQSQVNMVNKYIDEGGLVFNKLVIIIVIT